MIDWVSIVRHSRRRFSNYMYAVPSKVRKRRRPKRRSNSPGLFCGRGGPNHHHHHHGEQSNLCGCCWDKVSQSINIWISKNFTVTKEQKKLDHFVTWIKSERVHRFLKTFSLSKDNESSFNFDFENLKNVFFLLRYTLLKKISLKNGIQITRFSRDCISAADWDFSDFQKPDQSFILLLSNKTIFLEIGQSVQISCDIENGQKKFLPLCKEKEESSRANSEIPLHTKIVKFGHEGMIIALREFSRLLNSAWVRRVQFERTLRVELSYVSEFAAGWYQLVGNVDSISMTSGAITSPIDRSIVSLQTLISYRSIFRRKV